MIPVFVSEAPVPSEEELPQELRGLERLNGVELRDDEGWDQSVDRLVQRVERVLALAATKPPVSPPGPLPPAEHFAEVVRFAREQSLVIVLGEGANVREHATGHWEAGASKSPPSHSDLAAYLASEFRLGEAGSDLPTVADEVRTTYGRAALDRALRKVLLADYPAASVQRALARLLSLLHARNVAGLLLVTFNYDDVLERALSDADEPYDVVSYLAAGEHPGDFLHHPWEGEPIVVSRGNEYVGLPIDEDGVVERTVIVRLLGGVDRAATHYDGCVVSREDELDFATLLIRRASIPMQIADKLSQSHVLFLGLRPQAFAVRFMLNQLLARGSRSWAVQPGADQLSRGEWLQKNIEVVDTGLVEYIERLVQEAEYAPPG